MIEQEQTNVETENYSINKLTVGWHTSISPSVIKGLSIIENIHKQSTSSFNVSAQIFLKSPTGSGSCKLTPDDKKKIKTHLETHNIFLVIHGQYIINFIKTDIEWAIKSVVEDLKVINEISPNPSQTGVVVHMGKNMEKLSIDQCIENFYINIKQVIEQTIDCKSKIILETSTKTKNGNDIFHDIITFGRLTTHLKNKLSPEEYDRIGFCIDTAHIFGSGYDIRTREGFDNFMMLWNEQVGRLTVFHLNDSKACLCSCLDRHEQIGEGHVFKENKEGLQALLIYARDNGIPVILETDGDMMQEMRLIQELL